VRQEGWRALYSGLAPALIGSGVSWGAYLYLYERVKAWHRGRQGGERLAVGWNLLSAAQAGAMVRGGGWWWGVVWWGVGD